MKTIDFECLGYKLKGDIYEAPNGGAVLLSLVGRTSHRNKRHYQSFMPILASELGITATVFDYSGHGDSPFEYEDMYPARHFLEVISIYDKLIKDNPGKKVFVIGSSYGGFLATQLTKYRHFDGLILRAPAIYRPSDFYTKPNDEDTRATKDFRRDKEDLAKHPLLKRASRFKGDSCVIVHEFDEWIPEETTDAYANALGAEKVIAKGVKHSLDTASDDQIKAYNKIIYNWLKARV